MPDIYEDTNPRGLMDLLGYIERSEAALPDFQRDFVWDPSETQELIVSIASNYPAGSLLRIKNVHNLFACREFAGAQPLKEGTPNYLILDGQQRLTSLFQAFHGVGDSRYFLNLRKLADGLDFEDCIFHIRANQKRAIRLQDIKVQATEWIMPLSVLKKGEGGFQKWRRLLEDGLQGQERALAVEQLDRIADDYIKTIDDYKFPVVTLSENTGADAVCTIFETLNRTGVRLSPFELLTARFWPLGIRLRQLWQDACGKHPIIEEFGVDPYYLLQSVALLAKDSPSCKRSDVLNLTGESINSHWQSAVDGLASGLKLLRTECGVMLPKWLPYSTILVPLAAIMSKVATLKDAREGLGRHGVERWFWCSTFGQAYENSPNSQAARDYTEMAAWFDGGIVPNTIAECKFDINDLKKTTPRQRAIYRGTICLSLANRCRDFHSRTQITVEMLKDSDSGIDDHHLFPGQYLENVGLGADKDVVLNRALIDAGTNRKIGMKPPSEYWGEIFEQMGEHQIGEILRSHFLPLGAYSSLRQDNFGQFLEDRAALLKPRLDQVLGGDSNDQ